MSSVSFGQTKLSKNEWDYIEVPIQGKEKTIIEFIKNSFNEPENKSFPYVSILTYLKMSDNIDIVGDYLINNYIECYISQLFQLLDMYYHLYKNDINENYNKLVINIRKLFNNYNCIISHTDPAIEFKNNRNIKIKTKDAIRITNTFNKNNMKDFIDNDNIFDLVCIKQLINILLCVFVDTDIVNSSKLYMTPKETNTKIQRNKNKKTAFLSFYDFNKKVIDKLYALNKLIFDYNINIKNTSLIIFTTLVNDISLFISNNISNDFSIKHISGWIENNHLLNHYPMIQLYEHQKQIFNIFNDNTNKNNKFIYYCAPTGTGKTLTPLAIAKTHKVIFVCAARHIGLTFARNAITCGYKIALAFNCNDTEDIRLHYSSAKVFTKNYKSGGIFKVDNTVGDKVEIIISDLQSYPYASLYMKAFNDVNNIVTFWDEPTISLDYDNHVLHDIIHQIWNVNIIPNMILSSATLPNNTSIIHVANTFATKFNCDIHYIKTSDFNKSICIYDVDSNISTPHWFLKKNNASFSDLKNVIQTMKKDKTLMRYLHIDSCIDFISFYKNVFDCIEKKWFLLSSNEIKELYLETLDAIDEHEWVIMDIEKNGLVRKYYDSNIYFLTKDAYTLTNGASIFLTNDVFKIAKFCFKQLNIDKQQLIKITEAIEFNNIIQGKIKIIENQINDEETKLNPSGEKDKKIDRMMDDDNTSKIKRLQDKMDKLYKSMKKTNISNGYIPNSYEHLLKHNAQNYKEKYPSGTKETFKPFTSRLVDDDIIRIVSIPDIEDSWRLLLLCGIGIVSDTMSNEYNIIINDFAFKKKLFMLIASSDYIYGTNYAFHHGYIGKNMVESSRQKLIQAIGRIGRGYTNEHYSIRMRNDEIINILFNESMNNSIEADNMNRLFKFDDYDEETNHEGTNENIENYNDLLNNVIEDGWIIDDTENEKDNETENENENQNENETGNENETENENENDELLECEDWEELCL